MEFATGSSVLPVNPPKNYIRIDVRVQVDEEDPVMLPESRVCENLVYLPECRDLSQFKSVMEKSLSLFV